MSDYICQTHGYGHCLQEALDINGNPIDIIDAIKNRHRDFFCPDKLCNEGLYPIRDHVKPTVDTYVRAHFNEMPKNSGRKRNVRRSLIPEEDVTRKAVKSALRLSRDFEYIDDELEYVSEIKDNDGVWKPRLDFPVDIYCCRSGEHGLYGALHVFNVGKKDAKSIYMKIRELAEEPQKSRKRRFLIKGNKLFELPKRIHQNIIVVKNDSSFSVSDEHVKLKPTVHNFVRYYTDTVNFFDPFGMNLEVTDLGQEVIDENRYKHDESKMFDPDANKTHYFTLHPNPAVRKVKHVKKGRNKKRLSSNIPHWKLATFTEISVPSSESTFRVMRPSGKHFQMQFI